MAECKVRLYDRNVRVVAEGVVPQPDPPLFLALDEALYERLTGFENGYAAYRWDRELIPIEVTSRG